MPDPTPSPVLEKRGGVPRGIAVGGPALLSYGFRPFFLAAGLIAIVDMCLWIGALAGWWSVGGKSGPIAWHAHEFLFGYGATALCGFVLTSVPNWTGKLPVAGRPLLGLVLAWVVGRIAMTVPALIGEVPAALLDALFLVLLAAAVGREAIASRNRKNLPIAMGLTVIALLNLAFHVTALGGGDTAMVLRLTVSLFVMMISHVGGRLVPSFTRNVLAKAGARRLPRPFGRLDRLALAATALALLAWSVWPETVATAGLAGLAALLQGVRLAGWRGWATTKEPLLAVLHVGYAFVPLGLLAVAAAALGLLSPPAALHVLTVGGIGMMTLAVMTRASRGHTGRAFRASPLTTASYACLLVAALARPLADIVPAQYETLLFLSAGFWLLAFALFVGEHAPMLLTPSLSRR